MAIKIIFCPPRQGKLIRNKSRRQTLFSPKESSANPSQGDLTLATLATPNTQGNCSMPFIQ
jgi:hypothetical protein